MWIFGVNITGGINLIMMGGGKGSRESKKTLSPSSLITAINKGIKGFSFEECGEWYLMVLFMYCSQWLIVW